MRRPDGARSPHPRDGSRERAVCLTAMGAVNAVTPVGSTNVCYSRFDSQRTGFLSLGTLHTTLPTWCESSRYTPRARFSGLASHDLSVSSQIALASVPLMPRHRPCRLAPKSVVFRCGLPAERLTRMSKVSVSVGPQPLSRLRVEPVRPRPPLRVRVNGSARVMAKGIFHLSPPLAATVVLPRFHGVAASRNADEI